MKKSAKVYGPGDLSAELVAAAVSTDETRPHLYAPFGCEMSGAGWIVGTDGHRLHAVRDEAWATRLRAGSPPAAEVIPWDGMRIGEIAAAGLDAARHFPAKWQILLSVRPGALLAHVTGPKWSRPFGLNPIRVDWFAPLDQLTYEFGINLAYLLDAVDFVGTRAVQVWAAPYTKTEDKPLAPIIFTAPGVKTIAEAARIAVVMPCRAPLDS